MRTIITTVGTSLLTNRDQDLPDAARRPWAGWHPGAELPREEDVFKHLHKGDLQRASAETNTLRALPLMEQDRLVFLHSQTGDGQLCGRALARFYEAEGYRVRLREIGRLGFEERAFRDFGLKGLVAILFEEIKAAQGTPVFCATGGFKAEIAFVNLVGMLMGVEVYYMHEKFRELIRFPAFPVDWNLGVVERNIDFFEWVDEEPRRSSEVETRLHNFPEARPFVEETEDGSAYLSAAGDLLLRSYHDRSQQRPRAVWPPASGRSPEEKNEVSGVEHHRPQGWERIVDLLCRIDCMERVHYDGSAPSATRRPGIQGIDPETGTIQAVYERGGKRLPLVIETTGRGEAQCQLVADYIGRKLKA
jgi:putative CRISPR-associated protein (TIGR02619 family)